MSPSPFFVSDPAKFDASDPRLREQGLYGPVVITPEIAAKLLDTSNTRNRPISWRKVNDYAAEMKKGNWTYNPADSISIGIDGVLLNGQHRLLAVMDAGLAQSFALATGVEPDVQDVMDSGMRRTTAQQLHLSGYEDANALAAISRIVLRWQRGTLISNLRAPSTPDVRQFVENADQLAMKFAIETGRRVAQLYPLRAGVVGASAYSAYVRDSAAAAIFFDGLCDGVGLQRGDAILTLRNYLTRQSQMRTLFRPHHQLWLIVSTWNSWRSGRSLAKIMSPSEWNTLKFPTMV